jgi:uncharacterized membrane protein
MEQRSHSVAETVRRGHPRHRDEWGIEFSRIVAFSDGVFAIAITLLALSIEVPEQLPANTTVAEMLEQQSGDLLAYAISFAVVGKLWLAHHRFFSTVERFDSVLMGLNILYLAWIAVIPVTSEVLGDYGENSSGVIVYAISIIGVSLTFQAQIAYAFRSGLIRPELREIERRLGQPANLLITAVFVLSIPVALVSTIAATLMWLIVFLAGRRLVDRLAALRA